MKLAIIVLCVSAAVCTGNQYVYEDAINDVYCDTDSKYFSANVDENHVLYVDFERNEVISTLPKIVGPIPWDKFYGLIFAYAYNEMMEFKGSMDDMQKEFGNPPEMEEAPVSVMYPRDEVHLGFQNTLICYVTGFYPPRISVRWTRNNKNITEEDLRSSQIHITEGGSFNQFFSLPFTPEEGDIYTCTVEHSALERPLTREFEVEVPPEASLGLSVFCGVGLTLGLLGVATGTFFFVKGKEVPTRLQKPL